MRPVNRGDSPRLDDFENYRDAFIELVARVGPYCSYCERRIPTNLAVEHIQPKGLTRPDGTKPYFDLQGRWENFLLGCVNCNGTKGDKDVVLADLLLPDRDNTAHAYAYFPDGRVEPSGAITANQRQMAEATLTLCGLDKGPSQVIDSNGQIIAIDRYTQRMEAWAIALISKEDLQNSPTEGMRRQIVRTAQSNGHFSIWIRVFEDDPVMRCMLITGFTQAGQWSGFNGTAIECFDQATGQTISPRLNNGLPSCGKS